MRSGNAYAINDSAPAAPASSMASRPAATIATYCRPSAAAIRDRHGVRGQRQLRDPELGAGSRIERAEAPVVARADEHEPARRNDRPPDVERPVRRLLSATAREPERHAPRDLARRRIDGHELAPRRLLARPRVRAAACSLPASRPPCRATRSARAVRRQRSSGGTACVHARSLARLCRRGIARVRLEPADAALAARVDEDETSLRIGRGSSPAHRPSDPETRSSTAAPCPARGSDRA